MEQNTKQPALLNAMAAHTRELVQDLADARTQLEAQAEQLRQMDVSLATARQAAHQHQQTAASVRDALNGCQARIGGLHLQVAGLVVAGRAVLGAVALHAAPLSAPDHGDAYIVAIHALRDAIDATEGQ
ncbi:MAG: hypothetical protein V4857_14365 [Pseudomonadota bacterium]